MHRSREGSGSVTLATHSRWLTRGAYFEGALRLRRFHRSQERSICSSRRDNRQRIPTAPPLWNSAYPQSSGPAIDDAATAIQLPRSSYPASVRMSVKYLSNESPFGHSRGCELLPDVRWTGAVPPFHCRLLKANVNGFLLCVVSNGNYPLGIAHVYPVRNHFSPP